MRMLLVGALSVSLVGCSCPTAPQAMLETCALNGCSYRTAAIPPIEPTPIKRDRPARKVGSKDATKTAADAIKVAKPTSPQPSNDSNEDKTASAIKMIPESSAPSPHPTESPKSIVGATVNATASGPASEVPDPVLEKAKTTVASKMEHPASVEFEDMTRAIRKDSFGQSIDTICGHVRGKRASGTETAKRAFLYLVKEDIAFVDYGSPNSAAANAYRIVCISGGS